MRSLRSLNSCFLLDDIIDIPGGAGEPVEGVGAAEDKAGEPGVEAFDDKPLSGGCDSCWGVDGWSCGVETTDGVPSGDGAAAGVPGDPIPVFGVSGDGVPIDDTVVPRALAHNSVTCALIPSRSTRPLAEMNWNV